MPKSELLDHLIVPLAASDLADFSDALAFPKNEGSIFRGETFPSLEWRESPSGVPLPPNEWGVTE